MHTCTDMYGGPEGPCLLSLQHNALGESEHKRFLSCVYYDVRSHAGVFELVKIVDLTLWSLLDKG